MSESDPSPTASARRQSIEETMASDEVLDGRASAGGDARIDLAEGARLGRYVVLERLGAGAMGVVHAAFDPELDRRIALKLVHTDRSDARSSKPDRSDGGARLLREAQAIAKLRHPNVIVVHDVGTLGDHVFIAMEYLDRGTLRQWLDQAPRTWSEILPRFRAAAEGLAAAHTAGIVHRDFKPENVLLGTDANAPAGIGRVCVVDFGLARAVSVHTELESTTASEPLEVDSLGIRLTQTGGVVGTPAYMAPEQHAGEATDARSDQFSFCVALYEALFARRPFEGDTVASVAFHVMQGEVRPPPPGTDVPRPIVQAVMRGLAVTPADRHPSMRALIDALAHDPAARRRRARWAAGLTVAVAGVGGLAYVALVEDPVCDGAAAKIAEKWGEPQRRAMAAAIVASGVADPESITQRVQHGLDEYTAQWVAIYTEACEATHERGEQSADLLDRRMTCLESRRRHVGTVVGLLSESDPELVGHAGEIVDTLESLSHCEDAPALLAALPPPAAAVRERVHAALAVIDEVKTLRTAARPGAAAARLDEIADEVAALGYAPLTAHHLYYRAALALDQGRVADAERLGYEAAIACSGAKDYAMEAMSWTALLRVVGINGRRFDEVLPLVKAAEAAIARVDDPGYYQAGLQTSFGTVEMLRGNLTEAERRLREGRRLFAETMGAEHPQTLEAAEMLALTLYSQERFDEAEVAYREIIATHDRVSGPEHPIGASAQANLGLVYAARGRHAEALDAYEGAHARFLAAWGPRHPVIATSLMNISSALRRLGRFDEAEAKLTTAVALDIELFGAQDERVAAGLHEVGELAKARKQPERAIERYREAVAMWEKLDGPTHVQLGFPLTGIGEALLDLGRPAEAIAPLERALQLRIGAEGVPTEELAATRFALARALRDSGGDGARARDIATTARVSIDATRSAELAAALDAWLAVP